MKWEYFVWKGEDLSASVLKSLGDDGWELVSLIVAYPVPHCEKAIFKRPKVTP